MKFSFVINATDFKTGYETIRSILDQTYNDVEVIYLKDSLTDNSVEILKNQFHNDPRLQIVSSQKKGDACDLRDGVAAVTGDWVLFAHGNEKFDLDACMLLHNTISAAEKPIDMVCFCAKPESGRALNNQIKSFMIPYVGEPILGLFSGDQIIDEFYLQQKNTWCGWNKCYSTSLVKQIFESIILDKLIVTEDFFFNFVALSKSKLYLGISDQIYEYIADSDVHTREKMSIDAYSQFLNANISYKRAEKYAKENGLYDKYSSIIQQKEYDMIVAAYKRLCQLPSEKKSEATKLFFESFDVSQILKVLGHNYDYNFNAIANNLDISNAFPIRVQNIRTIGMFYHRMYNGGVERVIQLLTPIFRNAGYNVVVITNQPESENDYSLPEDTPRVVLGDPALGEADCERARKWEECINEHHIDAVIYHAWLDRRLFSDMVAIKKHGAAFIVHCHGAYFTSNVDGYNHVNDLSNVYSHADAIVTLSQNDSLFWSCFNRKTFTVKNPLTFDPKTFPQSPLIEKNIAWVCRYDINKNPFDALQIMQMVCRYVPDAKLYMIGGGNDEIGKQLNDYVKELGIEENIVFTGFIHDVSSYLLKSSVFLFTSNFEGYPMAFCEAISCGLPVVTYELPYISMIDDSKGTICVRWKDMEGAANALVDILTDDEKRKNMGALAKQEAIELAEYDFAGVWQNIFDRVLNASDMTPFLINEKTFEVSQRTHIFLINQLCRSILQLKNEPHLADHIFLDYRKIARWKRWIIYFLADKNTLKSIVKFKIQNLLDSLKIRAVSCKLLKMLFRW